MRTLLRDVPIFTKEDDECIWNSDSSGFYSVKAGAKSELSGIDSGSSHGLLLWLRMAPPKVQTFIWCSLKRKILYRAELNHEGMLNSTNDLSCVLYSYQEKDVDDHLFGRCLAAISPWSRFSSLMGVTWVFNNSYIGIVESCNLKKFKCRKKVA